VPRTLSATWIALWFLAFASDVAEKGRVWSCLPRRATGYSLQRCWTAWSMRAIRYRTEVLYFKRVPATGRETMCRSVFGMAAAEPGKSRQGTRLGGTRFGSDGRCHTRGVEEASSAL
jgi:hypothetical protein